MIDFLLTALLVLGLLALIVLVLVVAAMLILSAANCIRDELEDFLS